MLCGMPANRVVKVSYDLRLYNFVACKHEIRCLVVDCDELPVLLNGKVHVINTTYQSRVNFTCQDGYYLDGASSAVCLANGSWSNQFPRCISKDELMPSEKLNHRAVCIALCRSCVL